MNIILRNKFRITNFP